VSGAIASIEPASIASALGWQVGDEIVSINGHILHDVIDFRFYSADELLTVVLRRSGTEIEFEVEKDADAPLGVSFGEMLFDGVRTCGANCIFCFVDQLPKGLRKPLYLKDDDYRLSFIHGNFVTLANTTDEDLERIAVQRLSPLYVSVHATDPDLRKSMIRRKCPNILDQIDRLAAAHIELHTQIVLCPGINDGAALEKAVSDLGARYPAVQSIAVVPAGVSKHRTERIPIPVIDPAYARGILRSVRTWQREFLEKKGTRLVWAADEFYLKAGQRVPKASTYEGFPQIENGVGLVREFKESAYRARKRLPARIDPPLNAAVVTGMLAAPLAAQWFESLSIRGLDVRVIPVRNDLFGETVTVAGLVAGKDIMQQVSAGEVGDVLLVPSVMLRDGAFLDDVTTEELEQSLEVPVVVVPTMPAQALRQLLKYAANR